MIQYFLFAEESYALTRTAVLLGKTCRIRFDGAAEEGTLWVGDREVRVHKGTCSFPSAYLHEGENRLVYVQQNGQSTERFPLESLHRWGDVAGVKDLPNDKLSLALLAHVRFLRQMLCAMEKRVKDLENCCYAAPLFEYERKGENKQ